MLRVTDPPRALLPPNRNAPDFAWLEGRAGELAESLLRQGISAMKIWPFDQFGVTLAGPANPRGKVRIWGGETAAGLLAHTISNEDLQRGLQIVADIRRTVGDKVVDLNTLSAD